MSSDFLFIPRKLTKPSAPQPAPTHVTLAASQNAQLRPGKETEAKGERETRKSGSSLFSDEDYVNLVSLAFSDFALWSNPDLRRAIDFDSGNHSQSGDNAQENAGFIPLPHLLDHLPVLAPLKLSDHENRIAKALRTRATDVFDVRLILAPPSSFSSWPRQDSTEGRHMFEIGRKDYYNDIPKGCWTKDAWDRLTIYVENIPNGSRNAAGIMRLLRALLSHCTSGELLEGMGLIQGVSFPPHHQDKPGDAPTCKGFALVTLSSRKHVKAMLRAWPWDVETVSDSQGVVDTGSTIPEVLEATKFGLRMLAKERWLELREEYLEYRRSLVDEIYYHQSQVVAVDASEVDFQEETLPVHLRSKGTSRPGREQLQEPALTAESPYPSGCLVFIRNIHTGTNKTTLRALFRKTLVKTEGTDTGLDYVDYNKGMDSCHLRLAAPHYAQELTQYFSDRRIVQTSGLDDSGTVVLENDGPSFIRCEIVDGRRESIYWEKVPEKICQQAVQKALKAMAVTQQDGDQQKRKRSSGGENVVAEVSEEGGQRKKRRERRK